MAAILDHVSRTQPTRDVTAVHADRSLARHPLRCDTSGHGSRLASFRSLVWYEQTSDAPHAHPGHIDTDLIPLHPDAEVYRCGPAPFMQAVRAGLHRRGLPDERIRYEVFGPEQWRPTPALCPDLRVTTPDGPSTQVPSSARARGDQRDAELAPQVTRP